jgi:hypothetical protein
MLRFRYFTPVVLSVSLPALLIMAHPAGLPKDATFEEHPAVTLTNGKLTITVLTQGSTLASVVLNDDPGRLSPLWNPMRMAREQGRGAGFNPGMGQFVCVDGFGGVSPEERAAGMPGHGEAHLQNFSLSPGEGSLSLSAKLPLVQENFTRTFRMVEGENVVYVDSRLESLLSFDKPVNWAEHATIGSPWLESGVTVVDVSGKRSQTRPWQTGEAMGNQMQRRLPSGRDFVWPLAPAIGGGTVDMRQTPPNPHYRDHAATLLDPARTLEWVTAVNPKRRQILGYIFRRADYPWLQAWGDYPPTGKLARGMEFSTQPYDVSHRDAVNMGSMFDTPVFRWLPAKSKIETHFLMFFAAVPEGFTKTDDVTLENNRIVIEDHAARKQVTLAASRPL